MTPSPPTKTFPRVKRAVRFSAVSPYPAGCLVLLVESIESLWPGVLRIEAARRQRTGYTSIDGLVVPRPVGPR